LCPDTDWAAHEPAIAADYVDFMRGVDAPGAATLAAAKVGA